MIKTEELRIGSKVAMGDHHCTVNSIHAVPQTGECFVRISGFLDKDPQYQVYLYQLEPIPLTPEILLSCGFEKLPQQAGGYQGYLLNDDFELGWDIHNNCFYYQCANREGYRNECYVSLVGIHQLQNLYFALTGKELQYTPVTERVR